MVPSSHKNIQKPSWRSPDGLTANQIDLILIDRKGHRSFRDVRVCSGADTNTDYYLVIANIKLKLQKMKQQGQHRRQLEISKLKFQNTSKEFVLELRNRFCALDAQADSNDDDPDIHTKWETIKNIYVETGTKVQGYKEKKNKDGDGTRQGWQQSFKQERTGSEMGAALLSSPQLPWARTSDMLNIKTSPLNLNGKSWVPLKRQRMGKL